jgi:hypothetical protein
MKIFERDEKINFVDENNVLLGYDMGQCCCENADWFIADEPQEKRPEEFSKPEVLDGWLFDKSFFKSVTAYEFDSGGMAIFRITKGDEQKFIHIFNSHNGYYGHGFEFKEGNEIIKSETL